MHAILQAPYGALRHRKVSEYALSGGVGNRSLVPTGRSVVSPPEEGAGVTVVLVDRFGVGLS